MFNKKVLFLVLVGLSFCVYALTAARLPQGYADAEDVVLASYFNGRAHPPGYALLTIPLGLVLNTSPLPVYLGASLIAGLLQAISAGLLGLLLCAAIERYSPNVDRQRGYWISLLVGLTYGFSVMTWTHGTVIEVFSVGIILLQSLIYGVIVWRKPWKLWQWVVLGGLGVAAGIYHPLNWLVVIPVFWHVCRGQSEPTNYDYLLKSALISALVGIALLWLPALLADDPYSWPLDGQDSAAVLGFYNREIYTDEGSAVETYAGTLDIRHSMISLGVWLGYLGQVFGPSFILVIPGLLLLVQRRWWVAGSIIMLSGPILVAYMKFPLVNEVLEAEYYWGTALRLRMFFIFDVLVAGLIGAGLVFLYSRFKRRHFDGLLIVVTILMVMRVTSLYENRDLADSNFVHLYTTEILASLADDSLLIVDSDLVFTFWYQHLINQVRPDISIIGARIHPVSESLPAPLPVDFTHPLDAVRRKVSFALEQGRDVYLYTADIDYASSFGLEGNPFFAFPEGYTLKLTKLPAAPKTSHDLGLTVGLSRYESQTNDWWTNGLKAHTAGIHALQAYYAARIGLDELADAHTQLAHALSLREQTRPLIDAYATAGRQRLSEQNSYLAYEIPSLEASLLWAAQAESAQEREYHLTQALLRYPSDPTAYIELAQHYASIGQTALSEGVRSLVRN